MKKLFSVLLFILISSSAMAQDKYVLFSHNSVGRNMIGNDYMDPIQDPSDNFATTDLRTTLDSRIKFWDHDYSSTTIQGSNLVPLKNNLGVDGWIGASPSTVILRGLAQRTSSNSSWGTTTYHYLPGIVGYAQIAINCLRTTTLNPNESSPSENASNWRNFLLGTYSYQGTLQGKVWDMVILKPGYKQMHIPTDDDDMDDAYGNPQFSLETIKQRLNDVSDWWHINNPGKYLAICTSSSLRSPRDGIGIETSGWREIGNVVPYSTLYSGINTSTRSGAYVVSQIETQRYRRLNDWLKNVWINRHPENKTFLFWEASISPDSLYTLDAYKSGDHHLNTAGSTAVQAKFETWLEEQLYPTTYTSLQTPTISRMTIERGGSLYSEEAVIKITGQNFGTAPNTAYPPGRIFIGNASTYSTSTQIVGQEILTWSDTEIRIKTRFGSTAEGTLFSNLQRKYLFVLNRVDTPSSGYLMLSKIILLPRILDISSDRGVI